MAKTYDLFFNRGPIPITSIGAVLTYSPPIAWIQVVSAGSGGLVVKDEGGLARAYVGLVAGQTLYGPFTELTSMTLASMLAGDGQAPPPLVSGTGAAPVAASGGPFIAISVANQATLSGLAQTVDGVALSSAGMRVYLAVQTTTTQNGPWLTAAGNWARPADWASGATIPLGTLITIAPGGTSNFQAFGGTWYVDSATGVVDTGTIVAYPRVNKGVATLASGSPSTVTVSNLWIKSTTTTAVSVDNTTTAANGVKGVLTAGAGSGTLVITGPNTVTDVISYLVDNA